MPSHPPSREQMTDYEEQEINLARQIAAFNRRRYHQKESFCVLDRILHATTIEDLLEYVPSLCVGLSHVLTLVV